jgi:hypothetical protein
MSTDDGWWARKLGNPAAPAQRQQAPAVYQQQQVQYQQPMHPQAPTAMPQQQIRVTPENLYEAAMMWQGGEAVRTETNLCPKCGSGHYFSRSQGIARGPAPAPVCYTCGFNGMFTQGDPSVWQGA